MKIFQNKTPRSWKSSGVLAKGSQIEMSNFSFLEEFVKTSEGKFSINIIGKNIIGNGLFSIQIYKEEFIKRPIEEQHGILKNAEKKEFSQDLISPKLNI
jgi:hypothetical protein